MKIKQTYLSISAAVKKNRTLKIAVKFLIVFVTIAILAPFIANDKPLVCKYKNSWLFPAFSFKHEVIINNETINYNMGKDWKTIDADFAIFPLCAYSPNTIDADNAPRRSPFEEQVITVKNDKIISLPLKYRHWLGTTQNGNDVLSCIIHGFKIALSVGFFSMLIAALIGILLGATAGYYENNTLKIGYLRLFFLLFGFFLAWFYAFIAGSNNQSNTSNDNGFTLILHVVISVSIFVSMLFIFNRIGKFMEAKFNIPTPIYFPLDTIISRTVEILNSIPALLLIIVCSAITQPSYALLILIIGFLSWTNIARITRAEYLKAKRLDYVTSCKAIGMNNYSIIIKQILPNVLPIIMVQLVFGMAGAVLVEASLSFIGVGVPIDTISWGSLLNEARDHFSAWWLVLFPGICVFGLILVYNIIATQISKIK